MRPFVPFVAGVLLVSSVSGALWARHRGVPPAALRAGATPVIVELFSSEGCSSCPPADAWLSSVDRGQAVEGVSVIALEEHVDYWDRLGWRDPFAQAQFGDRQHGYARVLADHQVFTPEIVVDGRAIVGSGDDGQATRELRSSAVEPRAKVTLARHEGHIAVDVTDVPPGNDTPEIWLAITESGLATDVPAGENAGRRLAHAPIVRDLRSLGTMTGPTFHAEVAATSDAKWSRASLRYVAFVQRVTSRRIVGANVL
jgi:hypothetical protein